MVVLQGLEGLPSQAFGSLDERSERRVAALAVARSRSQSLTVAWPPEEWSISLSCLAFQIVLSVVNSCSFLSLKSSALLIRSLPSEVVTGCRTLLKVHL